MPPWGLDRRAKTGVAACAFFAGDWSGVRASRRHDPDGPLACGQVLACLRDTGRVMSERRRRPDPPATYACGP